MRRRRFLAAAGLGAATATAGCGFLLGDEPLRFSASPATVSDAAVSETGYEETRVTDRVLTREFTVAGQTREVEVTNQLAQYERSVDLGPLGSQRAATFVVFASPEVEVATQTFNPIADMSERELLERFESEYDSLTVGEQVGEQNLTVLGQSTAVSRFEGTASLGGTEVEVYIHLTKLKHESDFVVAMGIYPQRLEGEGENVVALLEGIERGE